MRGRGAGLPSALEEGEEMGAFWAGALGSQACCFWKWEGWQQLGGAPSFPQESLSALAVPLLPLVVGRTATPGSCIGRVGAELTSLSTSSLLCWLSACFAALLFSVAPASSFLLQVPSEPLLSRVLALLGK